MKSKIFFYLFILVIVVSCKKPEEIITGGGIGGGNGTGGSGGNTNRPPIANAGPDQTITFLTAYNKATLNGIKSYDSSGMNVQFFLETDFRSGECLPSIAFISRM
jgi:hypothetical protein